MINVYWGMPKYLLVGFFLKAEIRSMKLILIFIKKLSAEFSTAFSKFSVAEWELRVMWLYWKFLQVLENIVQGFF